MGNQTGTTSVLDSSLSDRFRGTGSVARYYTFCSAEKPSCGLFSLCEASPAAGCSVYSYEVGAALPGSDRKLRVGPLQRSTGFAVYCIRIIRSCFVVKKRMIGG